MNESTKNELRVSLNKAIEKWSENNEVLDLLSPMYWGANTVHFMTEAALAVIIACQESQEEAEEQS